MLTRRGQYTGMFALHDGTALVVRLGLGVGGVGGAAGGGGGRGQRALERLGVEGVGRGHRR